MANSNLFCDLDLSNARFSDLAKKLEVKAQALNKEFYLLRFPKSDTETNRLENPNCFIFLTQNHRVCFVNSGVSETEFDDYIADAEETLSYLYNKYEYREFFGRYANWSKEIRYKCRIDAFEDMDSLLENLRITEAAQKKNVKLLISLAIGSINDINRVGADVPDNILDMVKQKIQLFDADQTRFVYEKLDKPVVRIQGLSGTGKTELLLHKLKELYINKEKYKIFLTCHNKILSDSLSKRIPEFFDFVKVNQQIEWNQRLWCSNAWGRAFDLDSGLYRYICSFYGIPFESFNKYFNSFDQVCNHAIESLKDKEQKEGALQPAFDYILIDEGQDFKESFITLCQMVVSKQVYVAGDVFQTIFSETKKDAYEADYFLRKCYRTDPHTLMFAHGLGFGLFEDKRYRWLAKEDWEACGYIYDEDNGNIVLHRKPIHRFEDEDDEGNEKLRYNSIEISTYSDSIESKIIEHISLIMHEYPTCEPHDIAVIYLDDAQYIYESATVLELGISKQLGLKVNKTYETKEKKKGYIAISNRNNVKGLEFPFIICVTIGLQDSYSYRNSLYTMLTRSFIKSYLLLSEVKSGFTTRIIDGLNEILSKDRMIFKKPDSPADITDIETRFTEAKNRKPLEDIINDFLVSIGASQEHAKKLKAMTGFVSFDLSSEMEIRSKLEQLYELVK